MTRLSGWKRLWIFVSFLYLIPVAIFTISSIPKRSDIEKDWAYDAIEVVKDFDDSAHNMSTYAILNSYSDLGNKEIIERINSKYLNSETDEDISWSKRLSLHKLSEINKQYNKKIDNINIERIKIFCFGLIFWVIPITLLYLFGIAIRWIYVGFKADCSNKSN